MTSVDKLSKLVRMYPKPFVLGSSILVTVAGMTGILLEFLPLVSSLVFASGLGLYMFRDKVCEKIRWNPMQEMANEMSQLLEQVEQ